MSLVHYFQHAAPAYVYIIVRRRPPTRYRRHYAATPATLFISVLLRHASSPRESLCRREFRSARRHMVFTAERLLG